FAILHVLAQGDAGPIGLIDTIGLIWHGNEVWLVVLGGALFGAFPAAYAAAFETMFLPFMVLMVALIFRSVAIEFRHHAETPASRLGWDVAFSLASILVTFLFGLAVGNSIGGGPLGPSGVIVREPFASVR